MDRRNFISGFQARQTRAGLSYKDMVNNISASGDQNSKQRLLDLSWLKACSRDYKISADPADYIFAPVRAFAADIPNRNGHCFDTEDLVAFNVTAGRVTYRTFEGKPVLTNHVYDLPKANGAIVSASLIQDGPYLCPELIIAVDKTKNKEAYDRVASGEAEFSMGAIAEKFQCSVCKALFDLDSPCKHCNQTGLLNLWGEDRVLSYMIARMPNFIEHSLLLGEPPADPRALHRNMSIQKT